MSRGLARIAKLRRAGRSPRSRVADRFALDVQIGSRLASRREALGLSQSDLAEVLGCKQPHVSRVEGGAVSLSLRGLERWCAALGCSVAIVIAPAVEVAA